MKKLRQTKASYQQTGLVMLSSEVVGANKRLSLLILALSLATSATIASAGERESLEQLRSTTVNLVNLLVQEGVLSKDKADSLLKQAAADAAKAKELDAATSLANQNAADLNADEKMVGKMVDDKVRVQYVPQIVKNEMKEEIKKEVMAKLNYKAGERLGLPDWIDRLQWEGDLRLRYQSTQFPDGNPNLAAFRTANNVVLNNTTEDRDRARVRARLGVNIKVNDWLNGGLRMTTGAINDPISANETLQGVSGKYELNLDRVFLKTNITPELSVVGGRFENPWFSTDLVWDPDLAFDGLAASYKPKFNDSWSAFATAGLFSIDEVESSEFNKAADKWLFAAQTGIKWTSANKSSVKLGLSLYEFDNIEGITNGINVGPDAPYNGTSAPARTKGNSTFDLNQGGICSNASGQPVQCDPLYGYVSKFRELNLTGQVDIATFSPVHITLTGDYVRNLGFDRNEIQNRTGIVSGLLPEENVDAYQVRLDVGMPTTEKLHDWQVFTAYKHIEADAVVDTFTDSDFYQRGTNVKGWILGGSYGLGKNTWLQARWFSADEIAPRGGLDPLGIDVLLLDLNTKF